MTVTELFVAIVLALVFAVVIAVVFEHAKAVAVQPELERLHRVSEAIRTVGAPPKVYTTRLVLETGETIGGLMGMASWHKPGEAIKYLSNEYEILEVHDPALTEPGETERTVVLRACA
jgi:hypothetical protein